MLSYARTLDADSELLRRLEAIFNAYAGRPLRIPELYRRLVQESAVIKVDGNDAILYNPVHMLFLYIPERWREGAEIRVATLNDVRTTLKKDQIADPIAAAFVQGFEIFELLADLMKDAAARQVLEVVWNNAPHSQQQRFNMLYLLFQPLKYAAELKELTGTCRESVNRFIAEVKKGTRASIPKLSGLTELIRPVHADKSSTRILLVLGEQVLARYYILAHFDLTPDGCELTWEAPLFAM